MLDLLDWGPLAAFNLGEYLPYCRDKLHLLRDIVERDVLLPSSGLSIPPQQTLCHLSFVIRAFFLSVQSKMRIFVASCSLPTTSDTLTIGTYGQIASSKAHATIGEKSVLE